MAIFSLQRLLSSRRSRDRIPSSTLRPGEGAGVMGRCIDEEQAVAFAHGHAQPEMQKLVEEHLDECPRCFEWVAGVVRTSMLKTQPALAETLPSAAGVAPLEPAPANDIDWMSLEPGALVGRYEIVAHLGAGAMGV